MATQVLQGDGQVGLARVEMVLPCSALATRRSFSSCGTTGKGISLGRTGSRGARERQCLSEQTSRACSSKAVKGSGTHKERQ